MKTFIKKVDVTTKEELLKEISQIMQTEFGANQDNILRDLLKREESYSTGLENGFAIPHCRTEAVDESHILFLKVLKKIDDYETLDNGGVDYVISFIVPDNKEGEEAHLRLLSGLMRKLVNHEVQNSIKEAKDLEQIKKILEM